MSYYIHRIFSNFTLDHRRHLKTKEKKSVVYQSKILFATAATNPVELKLSSVDVEMAKPNIIGNSDKFTKIPEYSPGKK